MPIYGFVCQQCQTSTEVILPVSHREQPGPCPSCQGPLTREYTDRMQHATRFDPVVVHFNPKTGKYRVPGRTDARVPKGFVRQEAKTIGDVRALVKDMDRRDRSDITRRFERQQASQESYNRRQRSELYARMPGMTREGREFARQAIRYNDSRPVKRPWEPGVHIDAFENDRSNRDPYDDPRRGGKSRY